MIRDPSEVFEAIYESAVPGLVGTIEVAIQDNQNVTVFGPTAAGIIELVVDGQPTGRYSVVLTAPATEGDYSIHWSNDGSFNPLAGGGVEDLQIKDTSLDLPDLGPGLADSILCNVWTTSEDVLRCCSTDEISSDAILLEQAMIAASELLYLAGGMQFKGNCEITVRPCKTDDCLCGFQVLSRGHLVGWNGSCWAGYECGCNPVSRIKLFGGVREILEVKIDGAVVDPGDYVVEEKLWLMRTDGERWPRCQSRELPDTEEGTFSVTYSYGIAPPISGQIAASRLACEIVRSCGGSENCALPHGVVRQTRQGITVEYSSLLWTRDRGWQTGMGEIDFFLNAVNPNRIQRSAVAWTPGSKSRYARPEAV